MLGIPLVIALAGYRHLTGEIPAGTLVCVLGLLTTLYAPILSLLKVMETARTAEASLARMDDIFQANPPACAGGGGGAHRRVLRGCRFRLCAGPTGATQCQLRSAERSVVAIVGPSGSGKSTLLNLLSRFWDVDEGRITLGGVDLRAMRFEDLASHIAVVFQDVYLFSGTIYDNIAEGRAGADPRCHRGGGARRRRIISLWRCRMVIRHASAKAGRCCQAASGSASPSPAPCLKDAPIVLLDEATAAIDPTNERAIQTALACLAGIARWSSSHTTFPPSATPTILSFSTRARWLNKGTHDGLLSRGGLYAHLWGLRNRAARWQIGDGDTEAKT